MVQVKQLQFGILYEVQDVKLKYLYIDRRLWIGS